MTSPTTAKKEKKKKKVYKKVGRPLKQLTVAEFRRLSRGDDDGVYRKPVTVWWGQTFGGKDVDGKQLTTTSKDMEQSTLVPTGELHWQIGSEPMQTKSNWLRKSYKEGGPYKKGEPVDRFYYLGVTFLSGFGFDLRRVQVCSGPRNVLSFDCMDEVNLWVVK